MRFTKNELDFVNREDFVYCNNCKTEMCFNGYSYECPVCGNTSEQKART